MVGDLVAVVAFWVVAPAAAVGRSGCAALHPLHGCFVACRVQGRPAAAVGQAVLVPDLLGHASWFGGAMAGQRCLLAAMTVLGQSFVQWQEVCQWEQPR